MAKRNRWREGWEFYGNYKTRAKAKRATDDIGAGTRDKSKIVKTPKGYSVYAMYV